MGIIKKGTTNVLDLLDSVRAYIDERNSLSASTGVRLSLVDDQTSSTRYAIRLMQNNAMIGLMLVMLITWAFLGTRIAFLTSIGIPFSLAGTFIVLSAAGHTLNNTVLLGVVIALGMLVDDAIVVVESIYYRLQRGMQGLDAAIEALREVFAPVTTSVLTTVAAFLPLMLLPGVLGDFMRVIPMVVTLALLISLFEAYWMLPAHVIAAGIQYRTKSKMQRRREAFTHWVRLKYTRLLLKSLRYPKHAAIAVACAFLLAVGALGLGMIRFNFFESDASQLFYLSLEMPQGSTLQQTSDKLQQLEQQALTKIRREELRASVIFAGQMFTATEPLFGDTIGQVLISLNPVHEGGRPAVEIISELEPVLANAQGVQNVYIFHVKDGPPASKAIQLKIRGDDFSVINAAAGQLHEFVGSQPEFRNASLDFRQGNPELVLRYNN
jgi:multidrug efflux pump subunit AcrB